MSDSGTHQSTTPCPVKLHLVDGTEIDGTLWLLNDSGRAEGVVPLDVLLDGPRDFLAVGLKPTGAFSSRATPFAPRRSAPTARASTTWSTRAPRST
jgi:hypothetical protein